MKQRPRMKFLFLPILFLMGACSDSDKSASPQRVCSLTAADGSVMTESCTESQFLVQPQATTAYTLTCKIPAGLKPPEGVQSSSGTLRTSVLKSSKVAYQAGDAELPSLSWDCNSHFCPQTVGSPSSQPAAENPFCDVVTQNIQISVGTSGSTSVVNGTRTEVTPGAAQVAAAQVAAAQAEAEAARAEAAAIAEQTDAARETADAAREAAAAARAQANAIRDAAATISNALRNQRCQGTGFVQQGSQCVCDSAHGYIAVGARCVVGEFVDDMRLDFVTGNIDSAGTGEIIKVRFCPTSNFGNTDCRECTVTPPGSSFERGDFDSVFLSQAGQIQCNGRLVDPYHMKYFQIRLTTNEGSKPGWLLSGFEVCVKTSKTNNRCDPRYINGGIARWLEPNTDHSSISLSAERDTVLCLALRTYGGDDTGTDDFVTIRFPRLGGNFPADGVATTDSYYIHPHAYTQRVNTLDEGVIGLDFDTRNDFSTGSFQSFCYTFSDMNPFLNLPTVATPAYRIEKMGDDSWVPDYWRVWVFHPGAYSFLQSRSCLYDRGANGEECSSNGRNCQKSWEASQWIGVDDNRPSLPYNDNSHDTLDFGGKKYYKLGTGGSACNRLREIDHNEAHFFDPYESD